jgi:hypothetical protein
MRAHLRAETDDLGIDHDEGSRLVVLFSGINHQQAARHTHLHRREPHAWCRIHRRQHIVGELAHGVVDALDRQRCLAQDRVGEGDDR